MSVVGQSQPILDASGKKHRRETLRQILLPFLLAVLLIVACVVAVMSPLFPPPAGQYQISIVSNLLLMVFILCPALLCFSGLAIGMVVLAAAMNKGHDAAAKPLQRVEDLSRTLEQRTVEATNTLNRKTIDISSRFALVYKWLGVFERPAEQKGLSRNDPKH